MSFMFKPLAYDDMDAVNYIQIPDHVKRSVLFHDEQMTDWIAQLCVKQEGKNRLVLALDGYIGARFKVLAGDIRRKLKEHGKSCSLLDMKTVYKSEEEISDLTSESLPLNYEDDPVLLFGKLYQGGIDDFIDMEAFKKQFFEMNDEIILIYGIGSLAPCMRPYADIKGYVDLTPKTTAIRAREKEYVNIGDNQGRPFPLLMRRNYYVDFEIAVKLRKELLQQNLLDIYMIDNLDKSYVMMAADAMDHILSALVRYPFRAKPVYLEGIWGGEFIRKVRNIPKEISENIAWIFEFIPMEVSIVVDVNGKRVEFPFSAFLQKKGLEMMGQHCIDEFEGYFPIRFNYDDTWHSNGNMSVQVHPDEDFVIENYDEFGRQDEAYYVIATGHGAQTYCGFKGDGKEFLELAKQSEKTHQDVEYQDYINSIESIPGRQIMLPAGTIHASGRNQLILELGSLTIGSYTYKVYDYNRKDREGNVRPIHTANAEKVLHFERNQEWVKEQIAIDPILLKSTEDYREYIVGKTDLMYYETRRVELDTGKSYEGENQGQFTVVTVVDGEQVKIYSRSHPEFSYTAHFLDIVTIPATIQDYVIEAQGYQPVVIHKTLLKENYSRYKNLEYKNRKRG